MIWDWLPWCFQGLSRLESRTEISAGLCCVALGTGFGFVELSPTQLQRTLPKAPSASLHLPPAHTHTHFHSWGSIREQRQLGQIWKNTRATRLDRERSKGLSGCCPLVVKTGDTGNPSDFVKVTLPRPCQDSREKQLPQDRDWDMPGAGKS